MQAQGLVSPIIQYGASKDEKAQLACVALSDKQGLFCCNTEELCIRPHHHYSPCNNGKRTKGLDTLSGCIWFVFLCLCMISACTCLFLCVVLTASMDKKSLYYHTWERAFIFGPIGIMIISVNRERVWGAVSLMEGKDSFSHPGRDSLSVRHGNEGIGWRGQQRAHGGVAWYIRRDGSEKSVKIVNTERECVCFWQSEATSVKA